MAKANVVNITLPHGLTLKADKLENRTIRTLKAGDYIVSSLKVRGVLCYFYTRVTEVVSNTVFTQFGSTNRAHVVYVQKGSKFSVFRPTSA